MKTKDHWRQIAECIITEQMPANRIASWFSNKSFYSWFKKNYR